MPPKVKTCCYCKVEKPLGEFHRNRRSKDGRASQCKFCVSRYGRMWRLQNRDRKNETDKLWKRRNRDKDRAHGIVSRAIKLGLLVRPEFCDCCGESGEIEAHHVDYTKPLHVEWLQKSCHMKLHGSLR